MKKIFALILSVVMICSMFAACGESKIQGGKVTPLPTTEANDVETKPTEGDAEDTEPVGTEPTTTDPAPTEGKNKEVSLGAMQGGVYTNKYVGVTCTLDDKWTFSTTEELQDLHGNVTDLLSDSELAVKLGDQFLDMKAENHTDLTSINVLYQKLSVSTRVAYASMTEEEIIDLTLGQKDAMIESYKSAGIEATSLEKVTVTFCGETRTAILTTATIQGTPYYTLQLFDGHLGAYSVTITFASFVENNTENLLAMCSAIQ